MKLFLHIILTIFLVIVISFEGSALLSGGLDLKKKFRTSSDTSDVNRYSRLALNSIGKASSQTTKAFIDTAEMICAEKNMEIPGLLHLARAEYFFKIQDFKNAHHEAVIAIRVSEDTDIDAYLKSINFMARYYRRTGAYRESINNFNKAIRIAEQKKLKGYIPENYHGFSELYLDMTDSVSYRETVEKLVESSKSENDSAHLMIGYFRLGTSYTSPVRNFELADSLLIMATDLAMLRKDTFFISLSLANRGWNFYVEKRYNPAIKLYNEALKYSLPAKLYSNSSNFYGNLGTIYRDKDEFDKALNYYKDAIKQAELGSDIFNRSWVYLDMSDMFLENKDTANAYLTFVQHKKYNDLQMRSTSTKGLNDAMIKFEADTQAKELELLSLRIRNQRLLIYGFTGLIILSLVIGLLIFNRSRLNARSRMHEMNRKISEVTQANLRQQMNPHFIFNTLNSIQYYMYQHDKLATNNYLTKFSSLMRKVLENSQHTSVPLRDELDALKLYLELEKIRFKDKFDYEILIDEEIDTILYKVPTMLIQPYVENSISHGLMPSKEKGLIKINLELKKEFISCTIEDNGIGREAAQANRSAHHNSLGTQIVSSRLELVNALYGTSLKTVYTDLRNGNGIPEGTRVEIHIPILT